MVCLKRKYAKKNKKQKEQNALFMIASVYSKSVMSMTFVCFGIAKVQCRKLNIIGYFFSISYMPMHGLLKKKICKEK